MYRDEILDLYRNPLNNGELENGIVLEGDNPSCGDRIKIHVDVNNEGEITDIKHQSDACAICTAATSMVTEHLKEKTISELENLNSEWIIDKLGIDISPMRRKCAILPVKTIKQYQKEN